MSSHRWLGDNLAFAKIWQRSSALPHPAIGKTTLKLVNAFSISASMHVLGLLAANASLVQLSEPTSANGKAALSDLQISLTARAEASVLLASPTETPTALSAPPDAVDAQPIAAPYTAASPSEDGSSNSAAEPSGDIGDPWQMKLKHISQLNPPLDLQGTKLTGKIRYRLALRQDGSLINVTILESNGGEILNEAFLRLARMASPYPLPNSHPGSPPQLISLEQVYEGTWESPQ